MKTKTTLPHIALAICLLAPACTLEKTDDVAAFREAVPAPRSVDLTGPENAERGSISAAVGPNAGLLAMGNGGAPEVARWYTFTRAVRDGVNRVTGSVLGSVWLLVHTEPSSVGENSAEWGPSTDALDPVTYRFRVERTREHAYDYRLEGRPRASTSESDYRVILRGNGFGRLDAKHGDGAFTIDLEAAKALDPLRHVDESGTVSITHELPREISRKLGALPRTVSAELRPLGEAWSTIVSIANEDFTGSLAVDSHGDIDDSKATLLEDVSLQSRWKADGSGRTDLAISGGDLPESLPLVTATECWGSDFTRVYYADSATFEPAYGETSACVYDSALQ